MSGLPFGRSIVKVWRSRASLSHCCVWGSSSSTQQRWESQDGSTCPEAQLDCYLPSQSLQPHGCNVTGLSTHAASSQGRMSRGSSARLGGASSMVLFSPILEVRPRPIPLNLASRSVTNLPLSPKLSKKAPPNQQTNPNQMQLFVWKGLK